MPIMHVDAAPGLFKCRYCGEIRKQAVTNGFTNIVSLVTDKHPQHEEDYKEYERSGCKSLEKRHYDCPKCGAHIASPPMSLNGGQQLGTCAYCKVALSWTSSAKEGAPVGRQAVPKVLVWDGLSRLLASRGATSSTTAIAAADEAAATG
eukprot:jgi/Phyca11/12853/fgenesh1_pg.PHYCAscaffold_1_\